MPTEKLRLPEKRCVEKFSRLLPREGMSKDIFLDTYKPYQLTMREMIADGSLMLTDDGNVHLNPMLKDEIPDPTYPEIKGFADALYSMISTFIYEQVDPPEQRLDCYNYGPSANRNDLVRKLSDLVGMLDAHPTTVSQLDSAKRFLAEIRNTVVLSDEALSFGNELVAKLLKAAEAQILDLRKGAFEAFHQNGGRQITKTLLRIFSLQGVSQFDASLYLIDLLFYLIDLDRPQDELAVCMLYFKNNCLQSADLYEEVFVHRIAASTYRDVYHKSLTIGEYLEHLKEWKGEIT